MAGNDGEEMNIIEQLKRHEGLKLKPYKCPAGFLTVGYGHNIDALGLPKWLDRDAVMKYGITAGQAERLLIEDLVPFVLQCHKIPVFHGLNEARQGVLINMCFNLGYEGLMKFEGMLAHLEVNEFEDAAKHMEKSLWHTQVKNRAKELEEIMRSGTGLTWRDAMKEPEPEKEATVMSETKAEETPVEKPKLGIIEAIKLIFAAMGGIDAWKKEGDKPVWFRQRTWAKLIPVIAAILPVITGYQIDPEKITQTIESVNILMSHVTHIWQHLSEDVWPIALTVSALWGIKLNSKGVKDAVKRGETP